LRFTMAEDGPSVEAPKAPPIKVETPNTATVNAPLKDVDLKNDGAPLGKEGLRHRIEALELEIGGPKLKPVSIFQPRYGAATRSSGPSRGGATRKSVVGLKQTPVMERPLLSLIRGMERGISDKKLDDLVKKLDEHSDLIDLDYTPVEGHTPELRIKRQVVLESMAMIEHNERWLIEFDDHKNDVEMELPFDMTEFDKLLKAAETAMNEKLKQALAIQMAVDDLLEAYTKIIAAMSQKQLVWHSRLTHQSIGVGAELAKKERDDIKSQGNAFQRALAAQSLLPAAAPAMDLSKREFSKAINWISSLDAKAKQTLRNFLTQSAQHYGGLDKPEVLSVTMNRFKISQAHAQVAVHWAQRK